MGSKHSKVFPFFGSGYKDKYDEAHEVETTGPVDTPGVPIPSSIESERTKTAGPPLDLLKKASPTLTVSSASIESSKREKGRFYLGDKVLGNFDGKGEWYPGVITMAYDDLVYDIEYDDGDIEESVPATDIKLRPKGTFGSLGSRNSSLTGPNESLTKKNNVSNSNNGDMSFNLDNDRESFKMKSNGPEGSSFKILGGESRIKLAEEQISDGKCDEEINDYGAYDGSLDFVPRVASKLNEDVRLDSDGEDDEFAELEAVEHQKRLTSSLLSGERNDSSAVIKNLYREDSKSSLLSLQIEHESRKNTDNRKLPQLANAFENPEARIEESSSNKAIVTCDIKCESAVDEHGEVIERKHITNEGSSTIINDHIVSKDNGNDLAAETSEKIRDNVKDDIRYDDGRPFDEKMKMEPMKGKKHNDEETKPPVVPTQKQSHLEHKWDDDLFGINGMHIQRVDSIESLDGEGTERNPYCDTEKNYESNYNNNDFSNDKANDNSFYKSNAAEESLSESFYVPNHKTYEASPDWGKISEISTKLYENDDYCGTEEKEHDTATDSGWTLCHTADGIPYFYSYELQESRWDIPTYTKQSTHSNWHVDEEQLFQPSQNNTRPHTTTIGRHFSQGIVQSKHELASALNSNKAKSTLHLTNLADDDDDDTPYDLGLGPIGELSIHPMKKISSTSQLTNLTGKIKSPSDMSKGMKRPQSMAAMTRKKKNTDF